MEGLSLTFDQWIQVASAAGGWLAAAGTIAAAWVALHLARRGEKVRLNARAFIAKRFEGTGGDIRDSFLVTATNVGQRAVTISCWAWCVGRGKSQFNLVSKRSMGMTKIEHGEQATFDTDLTEPDYWRRIARDLVQDSGAKSFKKVRLEIYPTVGSAVPVVVDQDVLTILRRLFDEEKRALGSTKKKRSR